MKLIVGITGGVGSGKSTISKIFQGLGAEIIDADKYAHERLNEISVKNNLQSKFGDGILLSNGAVDRSALAKIVFNDDESRQYLEALIHPQVRKVIEDKIEGSKSEIIILDVPLLDSSPLSKHCTDKIFVEVNDEERFERVKKRQWTKEQWQLREEAQTPLDEKKQNASWILDNNQDLNKVKQDIENWIKSKKG